MAYYILADLVNLTGEWVSLIHTDFNIIKENMLPLQ